jgi:hypothetical protein|tara:strand:+ start:5386 stop:7353 length:1968 start_codon:yes stop_codon:yes gene_type:complete
MSLVLILNSNQTASAETLAPLTTKPESIISVSALVKEQLPDFIRQDHERLTEFLEAYYEWMEQTNGTLYSTFVLQDYSDIDTSLSTFITHFKNQYMEKFPAKLAFDTATNTPVDEKRLVKRIKEFYRAKGTEKAYRLLFRILHDTVIDTFYYPKTDILKSSSGKWITDNTLKISTVNESYIWNTIDKTASQVLPNGEFVASGIIRNVNQYNTKNASVAEIIIDEINGKFRTDISVTIAVGGVTGDLVENVYPVIQTISPIVGITSDERGQKYRVGERVTLLSASTGGEGAFGEITEINGRGGIVAVDVIDSGLLYDSDDIITFDIDTANGTGAGLTASIDSTSIYPGYYLGTDGQLSTNKKTYDARFYQNFSYEIKTDITLSSYKKQILDLIHPAGSKLFNQMIMKRWEPVTTKRKTSAKAFEISVLGHYTPYTFNTTENLRRNSRSKDLYPFGYNPSATGTVGPPVPQSGPIVHHGASASGRTASYYGLVYNDLPGRTGPSDTVVAGHNFAFELAGGSVLAGASGITWDGASGGTGPLYQGSQGVILDLGGNGLSGASASYAILGTAAAANWNQQGSYWTIYPHPNTRGLTGIASGCSFSQAEVHPFFYIDISGCTYGIETDYEDSVAAGSTSSSMRDNNALGHRWNSHEVIGR